MAALEGVTARTRLAIELGIEEARHRAEHEVGPAHLLLGLVQVRDGIGAAILELLASSLTDVYGALAAELARREADAP